MKIPVIFLMASCILSLASHAQSGVEKKTIATLGPGEKLAYGENAFLLSQSPETFSFVTVVGTGNSREYYCYGKDGSKTGPVKSPDPKYWAEASNQKADDCIPNDDPVSVDIQKYFDFSTQSVKFQGKNIGPAGQPMHIALSKDEQHLYAIILTMEMKLVFFDNTGRTTDITGMPEEIIVSPDGRNAFTKVNGTINPFDPDAAARMMANPEEMQDPRIMLVGMDGTKAGPFPSSSFKDSWFTQAGQWVVYAGDEIIVNGKSLFKTTEYVAPCDLWISSTGNDYAWANYQSLFFKSGSRFTAPLEIRQVFSGGKSYLKWISLEGGNSLVLYKLPF
jgi:hypothetical protein